MKTYFGQALRTAAGSFDPSGRASRFEFITYLVVSQLPVILVALAVAWMETTPVTQGVTLASWVIVSLPLAALSIRRFHDFGRSGWWSAPFLVLVARTLALDTIGLTAGWSVRSAIEAVLSYVDWLLIVPAVASFVAMLAWPGKGAPGSRTKTTGTDESIPVA
ncbi:DUF805 domain-containing protein [Novosphingobium resinovorum]|uniref:DUF805 domain-containing protein n=1 Tax=Novosphingobium resinovorum TaxID=158500 RepID=UPI002ED2A3F8|nr:DUF805 domain-containing protein [Novosphingobium resinovorum]